MEDLKEDEKYFGDDEKADEEKEEIPEIDQELLYSKRNSKFEAYASGPPSRKDVLLAAQALGLETTDYGTKLWEERKTRAVTRNRRLTGFGRTAVGAVLETVPGYEELSSGIQQALAEAIEYAAKNFEENWEVLKYLQHFVFHQNANPGILNSDTDIGTARPW